MPTGVSGRALTDKYYSYFKQDGRKKDCGLELEPRKEKKKEKQQKRKERLLRADELWSVIGTNKSSRCEKKGRREGKREQEKRAESWPDPARFKRFERDDNSGTKESYALTDGRWT